MVDIKRIEGKVDIIGSSTESCITAGLYYGYAGLVNGVLDGLCDKIGITKTKVVVTGGLAQLLIDKIEHPAVYMPDLTLQGLRIYNETIMFINKHK